MHRIKRNLSFDTGEYSSFMAILYSGVLVKEIMVKNRPNIYIADKSDTFFRDVLIKKKYGPT